jgi:hypothetical protein
MAATIYSSPELMDYVTVYAVDTSNLWIVHGHLTLEQAQTLFEQGAPGGVRQVLLAGAALSVAAELQAHVDQPEGKQALAACTSYLAQTETYRQVLAKNGTAVGHWLVVLYQFASGDATLRPMFIGTNDGKPGQLGPEQLLHAILEVGKRDLRPDGGILLPRIQKQGDVKLAPALAQRLRPH